MPRDAKDAKDTKDTKGGRRKVKRGRVTPKGPPPGVPQGRYTPPIPREQKVSPRYIPVLMFTFLILGMLIIVTNYVNLLPGPDPSNTYLLIGLGLITLGFITATRFH